MPSLQHYDRLVVSKQNLLYVGLWFIISFCSYTSHTIVPVPPTLILFLIGTFILFLSSRTLSLYPLLALPFFSILYFIASQTLIGAPFTRYMGVIFSIFYFIITLSFGGQIPSKLRSSLTKNFIKFSVILLVIECIWRITHPQTNYTVFEGTGDVRWIYQYKFGGLMYIDSNAVGIHIIILLFFIFYIESEKNENWRVWKIILIVLLILTFSRAAWAGAVIGWIYIRFLQKKSVGFYAINIFVFSSLLFFVYIFFLKEKIESDLSFQSKLEIFNVITKYFENASFLNLFFGVGFSNSSTFLGIYAHSFFMVFLIESGILGLAFTIALFVQFILTTNKKALFILIPFVVTTLSSTITFIPYFYVAMALMILNTRDQQKNALNT